MTAAPAVAASSVYRNPAPRKVRDATLDHVAIVADSTAGDGGGGGRAGGAGGKGGNGAGGYSGGGGAGAKGGDAGAGGAAVEEQSAEAPSAPSPISARSPRRTCSSPVRQAGGGGDGGEAATAPMAARRQWRPGGSQPGDAGGGAGHGGDAGNGADGGGGGAGGAGDGGISNLGTLNVVGATAVLFGESAKGGDGGKGGSAGAAGNAGQAGTPGRGIQTVPRANRAPTPARRPRVVGANGVSTDDLGGAGPSSGSLTIDTIVEFDPKSLNPATVTLSGAAQNHLQDRHVWAGRRRHGHCRRCPAPTDRLSRISSAQRRGPQLRRPRGADRQRHPQAGCRVVSQREFDVGKLRRPAAFSAPIGNRPECHQPHSGELEAWRNRRLVDDQQLDQRYSRFETQAMIGAGGVASSTAADNPTIGAIVTSTARRST